MDEMNKWYVTNTTNIADQGFIAEEVTGRDVAVVYDRKDAGLIAAAPEMLEILEILVTKIGEDLIDDQIGDEYHEVHTRMFSVIDEIRRSREPKQESD